MRVYTKVGSRQRKTERKEKVRWHVEGRERQRERVKGEGWVVGLGCQRVTGPLFPIPTQSKINLSSYS